MFIFLFIISAATAQTTGTELKADIDSNITNKTGPGSISKLNVGNMLKEVVDYADQKLAYKGDWESGTSYKVNDVVSYFSNGSRWICIQDNGGSFTPVQSENTDWARIGLNTISTTSQFTGLGTAGSPLTMAYYCATLNMYASGTGAPTFYQNFFNANWNLPAGVTMTKVRTGTGTYELRFSGDISIPYLDVTNLSYFFQIRFYNNPNIEIFSIGSSSVGSTRTLTVVFTNKIDGTLTDGFTNLAFEARFY
jgi:hypothetical protein